jgi:hypothetical protein
MELVGKHYAPASKEKNDRFLITSEILSTLSTWYPTLRLSNDKLGKALRFLGFEQVSKRTESYFPQKGQSMNLQNSTNSLPMVFKEMKH